MIKQRPRAWEGQNGGYLHDNQTARSLANTGSWSAHERLLREASYASSSFMQSSCKSPTWVAPNYLGACLGASIRFCLCLIGSEPSNPRLYCDAARSKTTVSFTQSLLASSSVVKRNTVGCNQAFGLTPACCFRVSDLLIESVEALAVHCLLNQA